VAHILLQCRKYSALRNLELGQFPGRQNLRRLLSERKVAAKVVKFTEQTQILGQFRISSLPHEAEHWGETVGRKDRTRGG
jgi:hypothetical protein